jgi:exonuclease III
MTEFQNLNITFSAINCNSMNVSTLGNRNSKTYLKIEGVTGKKSDIILLSDIRAKNKGEELKKMFGLTRNGSYKLYINSNKESRGVGIAIKRNIYHDIRRVYNGIGDDNVILLDVVIKNVRLTVGTVYGPNRNDVDFYRRIRRQRELWGNKCIIGGDFNTILCRDMGIGNLDREGGDRVPNRQNSNEINGWIGQNFLIDPFRALYPEVREYSYIPFRTRGGRDGVDGAYGKTRLDFFMISMEILGAVDNVIYEDRIGADFDHKEVKMVIGKKKENSKIAIKDSTLDDGMVIDNGLVAVYESIRNHLATVDDRLTGQLTQLDILLREKETVLRLYERRGLREEMGDRIERINANIDVVKGRLLDIVELLDRDITCNYRALYEVIGMEVKNRLLKIQKRIKMDKRGYRLWLVEKEEYMARTFGDVSLQRQEVRDEILRCDDAELKERAVRFKDFLDVNNERASTAFCRLSKEGGLCDDISQIRDDLGNAFITTEGQEEHIRSFYSELYKKKLDNILSIEGFLSMEGNEIVNREGKKLTEDEKDSLEGEVTLEELEKALDSSNFGSTSGWDGISFKVIRKLWTALSGPMLRMINETFREGELMESYKLGLIKLARLNLFTWLKNSYGRTKN